jgi:tRNA pseudouridine55 synthase
MFRKLLFMVLAFCLGMPLAVCAQKKEISKAKDNVKAGKSLVEMTPEARMAMLLPVDILVNHLPIHTLNDAETHKICHGQPVHVAEKDAIIQGCRLYDSQQRFVGIGRMRADGLLWPDRLLAFSPAA